jgi:hypothetical protein
MDHSDVLVKRRGRRFSLLRDVDLPEPVRSDNLTLEEADDLLQTWKLRGFHGGCSTAACAHSA